MDQLMLDIFGGERYRMSQAFGERPWFYKKYGMIGHNGIDYACPVGTPMFATHSGTVTVKKSDVGYGWEIRINNDQVQVIYGHLSHFSVSNGDYINKGDEICLSGNTGDSSGPHVHYGIREKDDNGYIKNYKNGYYGWVDPFSIYDEFQKYKDWAINLKPVPLCNNENWDKTQTKEEVIKEMNSLEKNIMMKMQKEFDERLSEFSEVLRHNNIS